MKDWWPDEIRLAGGEHLDPHQVAGYDAKAQYDPAEDIATLRAYGLGPGARLVDLGAGTGALAFAAARLGAEVTAVDVSPAMCEQMRERAADSPPPGVRVVEAGFLGYDHAGPPADFVFTRNALHQLPDFWKVMALDRIRGFVRTGGILLLRDLAFDVDPDRIEDTVDAWLAAAVQDPATGYTAADLATHLRTEFGTFTWLLEPMLVRCGFDVLDRRTRRSAFVAFTCRAR